VTQSDALLALLAQLTAANSALNAQVEQLTTQLQEATASSTPKDES
jgi:hypothetical protein